MNHIKRKVILHGPSTLTVSLPHKWVKTNNIKKGDELNINDQGNMLTVYPGEENLLTKKIKVDFSDLDHQSMRIITTVLHKSGYDEIEIIFKDPETVKVIQERINSRLIGYEIVEQQDNVCIVKNVSGDHLSELDALIRRSFLVTLSLAYNGLEEIKKRRTDKLKELLVLEETNNKLVNYCQRLLNKAPYKDEKTIYAYVIIGFIERICDDYRDIIKIILAHGGFKITSKVLGVYEKINALVQGYYDLFYKYSDEDFMKIKLGIVSLKQDLKKIKFNVQEITLRPYLYSVINRIYDVLGSTVGIHH